MEHVKKWISPDDLFSSIEVFLDQGYETAFTVTGMSMWPLLCHGRDDVILAPCSFSQVRVGDILLFSPYPGRYLLHRVTRRGPDSFETTGDGNCFRDGVFPASCLIARVVKIVRKGKTLDCQLWHLRLYARLWMALFPFRRPLFRLWSRLRPFFRT